MSSNIHALKNRPDVPPRVREAFTTWKLLMVEMKREGLDPESRTEIRVFLSWLWDECGGRENDNNYLKWAGLITNDDIIDWEEWAA
ncbi:MAG: hypothetical protein JJE28_07075 [Actinomycetales bacterium]|nr:hypothetical protein [Actinomycetales bacterium]